MHSLPGPTLSLSKGRPTLMLYSPWYRTSTWLLIPSDVIWTLLCNYRAEYEGPGDSLLAKGASETAHSHTAAGAQVLQGEWSL